MWSKKRTNIWLHRLNNNGVESKMNDAVKYFQSKREAIDAHNHMVTANPSKEIAHNLYVSTDLGTFKVVLKGQYQK